MFSVKLKKKAFQGCLLLEEWRSHYAAKCLQIFAAFGYHLTVTHWFFFKCSAVCFSYVFQTALKLVNRLTIAPTTLSNVIVFNTLAGGGQLLTRL